MLKMHNHSFIHLIVHLLKCLIHFKVVGFQSPSLQHRAGMHKITKPGHRKLLFDTQALVRLLEDSGFTIQQAKVFVNMLVNTTNSNMDIMYNDMVTKTQQEIMLQKVMSHIAAVKKDMIILEKSEFSTLLAENEKYNNRLQVCLSRCSCSLRFSALYFGIYQDMMNKVCLDNKLDVNLEKSQVKEMVSCLVKTRRKWKMCWMAEQDRHVTQNNMKIDTEVAGLKTMLESHKLDSIKYLAGSVFTCLTVVLGFYRIWM
uniref:Mitochondrial calcium uniporter regulator 1 n=1 Tax=Electrophorus electricus TaxID=8005 RepID=A0A4W4HSK5_ELEEL